MDGCRAAGGVAGNGGIPQDLGQRHVAQGRAPAGREDKRRAISLALHVPQDFEGPIPLRFLDTYRTICVAPDKDFRQVLENVGSFGL